jgi:purine nucleoside phosphorylase
MNMPAAGLSISQGPNLMLCAPDDQAYDPELRRLAQRWLPRASSGYGRLRMPPGPSFETPADLRFLRMA